MTSGAPIDPVRGTPARPFYRQLWFLVLLAMAIGIALGHFYPDAGVRMEPLGEAFIKAIRVLIAPIIFCTVVHGISSMADMAKVGRVALKALIYFEVLIDCADHRAYRGQSFSARRRHECRRVAHRYVEHCALSRTNP
jgi:Sodium:dicarboxylate symporter family